MPAPERHHGIILVADDNESNRELLCSLLVQECNRVIPVTDGPDGLKGDQVPLAARILQITDIYDALTTDRPYRRALSREKAFEIIRDEVKRGWWDASVVNEFEAIVHGHEPVQTGLSGRK